MTSHDTSRPPLSSVVAGEGSGVVLVHGAAGSPEINFPFIAELAERHTVVAPRLPAGGPLDLDHVAEAVLASADEAALDRFALVGYSLGAAVAIRLAARHPDRVSALVLTAGLARADGSTLLALRTMAGLLRQGDKATFGAYMTYIGASEEALAGQDRDGVDAIAAMVAGSDVPAGAIAQTDLVLDLDVSGDLSAIVAPTLVVATTEDRLVHPSNSAQLAAGIADSRLVEIASGHGIAGPSAERWRALIVEFLAATHATA